MGLPGRPSLARVLLLSVVLSGLALGPGAAPAGAVDSRRTPLPGSATLPVRGPRAAGAGSFVPGRVLVGFEAGAGERGRRSAAAAVDGQVMGGTGPTRVVALDRGADVRVAARRLAARRDVAFAEPDWIWRVDACDPAVCWHLQPRPGADVVAAHAGGHRGAGRTVAVVDTGVATGVADLAGQVSERWRCSNTGCVRSDAAPTSSHGTEVASVVAALDDGAGTTGVAPAATVVSYRVDGAGGIPVSYLHQALARIAADGDVDVVNLSLGGAQWSQTEQDDIRALLAAGKVVVAAAGNTGDRVPQYPAAFPGVLSVGATDAGGRIADFSSYGKVDVVAPGQCVAVAEVAGFAQDRGCPGDSRRGVAFNSGTSFAAPIVSGLAALADSGGPLLARLAVEASADEHSPAGPADAKQWAHGLVDAQAFLDAHDPDAPPALVLETTGEDGHGGYRPGSGDGQLPHPETAWRAYAFQVARGLATSPPDVAGVTGAAPRRGSFDAVPGHPEVFAATLDSGALEPGLRTETATATVGGQATSGSVPVLALAADDQAPGVALVGGDDDAWRRVDRVDGDDLDDVYAVTLGKGDRLDVSVASLSPDPVAVQLFDAGTDDVLGRLDRVLPCGGGLECPASGLEFTAPVRGTYLLDVYSTGSTGDYRFTWTVQNAAGLPIEVTVPACSPNGDGVQDTCAWTAAAIAGWTITSFVTRGTARVARLSGPGGQAWDGRGAAAGAYRLRVLYAEPGSGRVLLSAFTLVLDPDRPRIADATAAPNPFEPRPHDGDRDTTTFAMTSSEPGRLRVVISRADGGEVRVLESDAQKAGRQRLAWTGRTAAGAWLRGRFSYVIEATDAAGNTARSGRHTVRVS
jgi:hypothetical protein